MAKLDAFFKLLLDQGASDLHLVSGSQPILRVHGELRVHERVRWTGGDLLRSERHDRLRQRNPLMSAENGVRRSSPEDRMRSRADGARPWAPGSRSRDRRAPAVSAVA